MDTHNSHVNMQVTMLSAQLLTIIILINSQIAEWLVVKI